MAIKVAGTTVIDDSRNACNLGNVCATVYYGCGANLTGISGKSTGEVVYFPGLSTAPSGYVAADGSILSKATYCGLYTCLCGKNFGCTTESVGTIYNFSNFYAFLSTYCEPGMAVCNTGCGRIYDCPLFLGRTNTNYGNVYSAPPAAGNLFGSFLNCNCGCIQACYINTSIEGHGPSISGITYLVNKSMTTQGVAYLGRIGNSVDCFSGPGVSVWGHMNLTDSPGQAFFCAHDCTKMKCYWHFAGCSCINATTSCCLGSQTGYWAKCHLQLVVHTPNGSRLAMRLINTCCRGTDNSCMACLFNTSCGLLYSTNGRDPFSFPLDNFRGTTHVKFNWICGLCGCTDTVGYIVTVPCPSGTPCCAYTLMQGTVGKIHPCANDTANCTTCGNCGRGLCGAVMHCISITTNICPYSTVADISQYCWCRMRDTLDSTGCIPFGSLNLSELQMPFGGCSNIHCAYDVGNDRAVTFGRCFSGCGHCFAVICFTTTDTVINCYPYSTCVSGGGCCPIYVTYSNALNCWFMADQCANIWASPGNCGTNWTLALCGSTCLCAPVAGLHDLDNKFAVFTTAGTILFTCGSGTWVCRNNRNRQIINDKSPRLVKIGNYYIGQNTAYTCDLCCTGFTIAPGPIYYSKSCGFTFSLNGASPTGGFMNSNGDSCNVGRHLFTVQHAIYINRNENENIYWKECVISEYCCGCNFIPSTTSYNCDLDKIYSFGYGFCGGICGACFAKVCLRTLCLCNATITCGIVFCHCRIDTSSGFNPTSNCNESAVVYASPYGTYEGFIGYRADMTTKENQGGGVICFAVPIAGCISGATGNVTLTGCRLCDMFLAETHFHCFCYNWSPFKVAAQNCLTSTSCCQTMLAFLGFTSTGEPKHFHGSPCCAAGACGSACYECKLAATRTNGNEHQLFLGCSPCTYVFKPFYPNFFTSYQASWTMGYSTTNRLGLYENCSGLGGSGVSCGFFATNLQSINYDAFLSNNYIDSGIRIPFGTSSTCCGLVKICCVAGFDTSTTNQGARGVHGRSTPFDWFAQTLDGGILYRDKTLYLPFGKTSAGFDTANCFQVPNLGVGYFVKT